MEKYWMQPTYQAERTGLQEPEIPAHELLQASEQFKGRHIHLGDSIAEYFWLNASDNNLHINVHQSYFDIAAAGMEHTTNGDTSFVISSSINDPEWATFTLPLASVLQPVSHETMKHNTAVLEEIDAIVDTLAFLRYETGAQTNQLVGTYFGSLSDSGIVSHLVRQFVKDEAGDNETTTYPPADNVLKQVGHILFPNLEHGFAQLTITNDGRFQSNTGIVMGTGSIEVLPGLMEPEEYGYEYGTHNIDSAPIHIWALCGLAKLWGDAHRFYAQHVNKIN